MNATTSTPRRTKTLLNLLYCCDDELPAAGDGSKMSSEFKWTPDDVERLISASKSLYSAAAAAAADSSDEDERWPPGRRRQQSSSTFDNAELLLTRPQFINTLILEIVSQQQDEVVDSPPEMSERWKKIIGERRGLSSFCVKSFYSSIRYIPIVEGRMYCIKKLSLN